MSLTGIIDVMLMMNAMMILMLSCMMLMIITMLLCHDVKDNIDVVDVIMR